MGNDLGVIISGDRAVELKFETFPQRLHTRLFSDITTLTGRLAALVRSRVPSQTGKLESQIVGQVFDADARITGRVTVAGVKGSQDFAKAGALEYGAHNLTKVRAHEMRLDHVFADRLNAPLTVMVDAYQRTPNIAESNFMRGSIEDMHGEIVQGLRDGVSETAADQ